jgi:5-amino-6-(5-phosphoribosylamino)uracil reductase
MSVDGFLGDMSETRLILSNPDDLEQVDALRAESDAILVGAGTVRADNPGLAIRSGARRAGRVARGLPPEPLKVTLTNGGDLNPAARLFRTGEAGKLVYCPARCEAAVRECVGAVAEVVGAGETAVDPDQLLADLAGRGVRQLLVEGGGEVNALFLAAGVVDEWRLAIAPFLVGEPDAPRVVRPGRRFPHNRDRRMTVKSVDQVGDMVVIRYLLSSRR